MLSIRKIVTASKAIAIQVVEYQGHKSKVHKHVGSARSDDEVAALIQAARNWIEEQSLQIALFSPPAKKMLDVEQGECISVTHLFARQFLFSCLQECGLGGMDNLLKDLVIMRFLEPASKLRTIELLGRYFNVTYSQRFYRKIPGFLTHKTFIEQTAFHIANTGLQEQFYFVLYDVTTLYFETFHSDDLRIPGFSKDNKPQQPQIVVGLLVTQSGFPLVYEVFSGNTFEGKTMLPILEQFMDNHPGAKPIIVADAAMLSEERLDELKQKGFFYIVGARLANSGAEVIQQAHAAVAGRHGLNARIHSAYGYLVCDFSSKRYSKELYDLNGHIAKAEKLVAEQSVGKRALFIKTLSKEKIALNEPLIQKRKLLLGIKGYCTNISPNELSNEKIIEYYHDLWRVEQSFRMSKTDLQARPVFHRKEDAIKSHILICFVALIIEKYLELNTNLSLRQIKDLIWNITETHIQDRGTKEIYPFRSPTKEILKSPLAPLIKKWKILPH